MSSYAHFQQARKLEPLPMADKVGVCLTCKFWDEEQRDLSETALIARCVQPDLKGAALLVSGSSACNKWSEKPDVDPEAKHYAESEEDPFKQA